jgi:enterochelin esterase-like enzyme
MRSLPSYLRIIVAILALAIAGMSIFLWTGWPNPNFRARLGRVVRRTLGIIYWVDPDRSAPAGTTYETFFSRTIGRQVSYLIYLPPDYQSAVNKRYPVIYWLHSLGSTQREGAATFVPRLDAAIRSREAPAAIVVLVNGLGDSRFCDSYDGKQPVESVIIGDLIPHIDTTYRTVATRAGRAVEGFSMGGFGAAHLGFKYPEVFGAVSVLSGALWDAESVATPPRARLYGRNFGGKKEYFEENSPWNLVAWNADAIRGRTLVRVVAGDRDGLSVLSQKYHELLETLHIEHEYSLLPGIGHDEVGIFRGLEKRMFSFYATAFSQLSQLTDLANQQTAGRRSE